MRTILMGDIIAAARALMCVLPQDQRQLAQQMLDQAHMAHVICKRLGRPHIWGNGSLMARANLLPQRREPFASDPAFLRAISTIITALSEWRAMRGL